MTPPREQHPGTTYHITRTTIGRMFLLRPDSVVTQVFLYCLFRAADIYGVLVHSVMVESNHFHMVITDVRGELSRFMCWLDSRIGKCLIAHYEKLYPDEHLAEIWSKDKYNAVVLANANAVIQAITYDATNPVKDGLVHDYREWPGLKSRPGDWMQPARSVKRPVGLGFNDRAKDHREVTVRFVVPPALKDRPLQHAVDGVHTMIRDTTKSIRKELALEGHSFMGAEAVCAVHPFDAPRKPRPKGRRVPTFAAGGDMALLKEGLQHVRSFRGRYRDCIERFLKGARDVVFPAGTYLMRVRFGVPCDDWSPPWCYAT